LISGVPPWCENVFLCIPLFLIFILKLFLALSQG
jgi:hypothetical protein